MPDQPHRTYRGPGAPGRQEQRSSGGEDPLAELARLIGSRSDPFASQPRGNAGRNEASDWRTLPETRAPRSEVGYGHYPQHADEPAYYGHEADPRYGAQPYGTQPAYGAPPFAAGEGFSSDPYYHVEGQGDGYAEEAAARRRGGVLAITAVLALALLGTAAAFGYRAVFGGSSSAPPPVIKADTTPNKIVPATTPGEQSKLIYDRVGDRNQPERIVPREEKPVDVADSMKAAPRVIPTTSPSTAAAPSNPIAAAAVSPDLPPNASALAATGAPGSPATAPKRVRTVTIKPDGPDAEAPVARPAPARPAAASQAAPVETVSPPPAPIPGRSAAPKASAPQANPNAPLSLSPNAAAARATTMRTASAPSAAPAAGGGYSVQVSSQRSEADAQAAFRSLQRKYPDVLGGYQANIRRADLGEKGVYYRVQVGPFASDQATELCSRLQSAGGQCVVQRN
jgi:cell division septation protein DedD